MGETQNRLNFLVGGLTFREADQGFTAYEATSAGVTYRVIGTLIDAAVSPRRTFRAYRVTGVNGHALHPAGAGGEHKTRAAAYAQAEQDLADVLRDREAEQVKDEVAEACPAGDSCTGAAYPGHPAHYAAEIKYPSPACPDAEAGTPHGAHRIDGTWRTQCPGVLPPASEPAVTTTATPSATRSQQLTPCDSCGVRFPLAKLVKSREVAAGSSETVLRCPPCDFERSSSDHVTTTTAARRAELPSHADRLRALHVEIGRELAALDKPVPADPATEDDVAELVDRIVRRAQYEALKAVLAVLAGWVEGAEANHDGFGHRGADECGKSFDVADIRAMINDAAREIGTAEPWTGAAGDA